MENIAKTNWALKAILLLMLEPACFSLVPGIHRIFLIGAALIAIFYLVLNLMAGALDRCFFWIVSFFGTMLVVTLVWSPYVYPFLREYFVQFGLCMLFYHYLKKDPGKLLGATSVWDLYLFVNLATLLIYPTGLATDVVSRDSIWFLGGKNPQIRLIIPILSLSLLRTYWKKTGISLYNYILIAVSAISVFICGSGTALLGLSVYLVLFAVFCFNKKKVPAFFTLNMSLVCIACIGIAIIAFEIQSMFSYIIEDLLGKALTFTGRTVVWEDALKLIADAPILGYGYYNAEAYRSLLYVSHPHNYGMYLLMTGGVFLVVVWAAGIVFSSNSLHAFKNSYASKIVLITLVSLYFMGIDESLTNAPLLYPMMVMAMLLSGIVNLLSHNLPDN